MSFEIDNFSAIGGQARAGNSPAHWSYESNVDALAAAQAAGYFNAIGTQVSPGDFINVSLTDGKGILTVASIVLSPPAVVIDAKTIGGPSIVEEFTTDPLNLVVADNRKFFVINDSLGIDVIIPQNSSQPFPIGAEMNFIREGAGIVLFIPIGSAVLQSRDGLLRINAQYSVVTLKKIDTDEWRLFGDLA